MAKPVGSKGGAVVRAPSFPSMWPQYKSQHQHHMRVEFVVGSLLIL